LIAILIAGTWAIKNLLRVDHQGWFNNTAAVYQVLSTVVIVVVILTVSQQLSTASFVWTSFNNQTGISSVFYVCLISLLMTNFSFSGYEASGHMAEETKNSSTAAPKGIYITCIVTALTGFVYILGLLYASQCIYAGFYHPYR
jgi:amino acid transporter